VSQDVPDMSLRGCNGGWLGVIRRWVLCEGAVETEQNRTLSRCQAFVAVFYLCYVMLPLPDWDSLTFPSMSDV